MAGGAVIFILFPSLGILVLSSGLIWLYFRSAVAAGLTEKSEYRYARFAALIILTSLVILAYLGEFLAGKSIGILKYLLSWPFAILFAVTCGNVCLSTVKVAVKGEIPRRLFAFFVIFFCLVSFSILLQISGAVRINAMFNILLVLYNIADVFFNISA